ncbi:MAG TPA: Imm10 family immunity protein [Gaiellaceae bacterium]|nr:Imm10 family immunity protein [Gaiellaceae bacterium]
MYSIGLSEEAEFSGGFAVSFQIAEPDDEESGYCLVAEPGQRTAYDAITSFSLDRAGLRLTLGEQAAAQLELPERLMLQLAITDEQFEALDRGLRRVGLLF